jgi:hypothetical protein
MEASVEQVSIIGLDIAKSVFQAHGADASGGVVFRKKINRARLLEFFASQPPCTVAMEACGGAHHWGRKIAKLGASNGSPAMCTIRAGRAGSALIAACISTCSVRQDA